MTERNEVNQEERETLAAEREATREESGAEIQDEQATEEEFDSLEDTESEEAESEETEGETSGGETSAAGLGLMSQDIAERLCAERVAQLMETTVFVKVGDHVAYVSEDGDGERFQLMTRTALMAKHEDMAITYENENGKKAVLFPAREWLRDPAKRRYKRLDYRPGECPEGVYNLFQGWGVAAGEGSCRLFLNHMRHNVCRNDEGHYEFLLDWMADIFQNPASKHNTAVALQGVQGTGKTFFAKVLGSLVGQKNFLTLSSTSLLAGRFNRHLEGKMLVFADEALPPEGLAAKGKLKSIISDDKLTVEPKGKDAYEVSNFARFIFASNNDLMVPAENNERRYFVLKMSDARANDDGYFRAVHRELEAGGYEALMKMLLERRITHNLRRCPKTVYLQEQMLAQQDPTQAWFCERLAEGYIEGDMALDVLVRRYAEDLRVDGYRPKPKAWLSRTIRKLFPHAGSRQQGTNVAGARRRVNTIEFGPSERCREDFERSTGIVVAVEADEATE